MTCSPSKQRRSARAGQVLLIASNFPPVRGGSAVVYENLARRASGRIVVLAASHSYADGREFEGWRGHDAAAPYPISRQRLLRTPLSAEPPAGRLARLLRRAGDVGLRIATAATLLRLIVTHRVTTVCVGELLASAWILRLLRWTPGVRTLAYIHGEELTTMDDYDPDHQRARRALQAADGVVAVSRFAAGVVEDLLGPAAGGKLHIVPNGVDRRRLGPRQRRSDLVARYGLDGDFVFVSVCRLLEKKGVDHAIRAFAQVVARHPRCKFLVVGTGPFGPDLERLARDCGVAGQVIFAGQAADAELADHYALADVFVMPNRALANGDTEGFGLVFLEANACGAPAIAGCDGGSVEAVEHGVNGLVVNGRSVAEIAAAMLKLREDQRLRERLRDGGLARAAEADWDRRIALFLAACDASGASSQIRPSAARAGRPTAASA